jgi:hypothetical protein
VSDDGRPVSIGPRKRRIEHHRAAPHRRATRHRLTSHAQPGSRTGAFLADLIVAETIDVLESFYKTPRSHIATAMRSLVALRSVVTVDPVLLRALEVDELDRIDFAEACLWPARRAPVSTDLQVGVRVVRCRAPAPNW